VSPPDAVGAPAERVAGPPPLPCAEVVLAARPVDGGRHDAAGELPAAAYAAALAGLPGMGPARLVAILGARAPDDAWAQVRAGRSWGEPAVKRALGPAADRLVAAWRLAAARVDPARSWHDLAAAGFGVAAAGSPGYPTLLAGDVEPPAVVFHRGDPRALDGPRVAIVGTRRCSTTGAGVAFELGRDLAAAGVAVVSGLAAGIDGAAHRGALAAAAAPPVGVVATGLDVVYPPGQHQLWHAVAAAGLLLSEAPLGTAPERWRFPARNRIIAALADVVVVVESHRRGGSLYTVDEADRRGRDVLVVPGSVRSAASAGTNALLAEGRAPACSVDDVLVALGLAAPGPVGDPAGADRRPAPHGADRPVLEAVGWRASSLDELVLRTGLGLPALAAALDRLCEAGWVACQGGWYERITPPGPGLSVP
jgi:DNA processing protein